MADRLGEAVRLATDPWVRLRHVLDEALVLVPHGDGASVELVDGDDWLTYVCTAGALAGYEGTRIHADSSLSGMAMRGKDVLWCRDVDDDPRVDVASCRRLGICSMVCVPLRRRGLAMGALKVTSRHPDAFTESDLVALQGVADFLSAVVAAVADVNRAATAAVAHEGEQAVAAFVANVLQPHLAQEVATRAEVQRTIDERDFAVVFQPVVDLASGTVSGYEALTRFPDGRPPNVWFGEAAAAGLGVELELAALTRALDSLPADLAGFVSINLSPVALVCPDLAEQLAGRTAPLVLELTEHESVPDYALTKGRISELRSLGVQIAVDDVGSGFASLRHVVDLHPDIIKIDRSLISRIDVDPARQALAAAFTTLALSQGWSVVAEGIEREQELDRCAELGIAFGQGYLLGRPGPLPGQLQPEHPWVAWTEAIWDAVNS